MLSIDFLKPPRPITVAGMEFMDYQDPKCYLELVKIFNDAFEDVEVDGKTRVSIKGDRERLVKIEEIIFNNFGIKVKLLPPTETAANASIDTGFFTPNHVFNNRGAEELLSSDESNIGRAFRRLNTDVLKGWVDTSKGRVGGDYSKIEFTLRLGKYIDTFLEIGYLKRNNVTLSEAVAMIVLHEIGHIFTSFLFVTRNVIDTIMPTLATKLITEGKRYGKERSVIVYETLSKLECTTRPSQDELDRMGAQELVVMFDKAINTRDIRRTLSLGATDRGSEIYADLFAVRCGVPKAAVAALANVSNDFIVARFGAFMGAIAISTALLCCPFLASMSAIIGIVAGLLQLNYMINPNDFYDSPYRRLKNIMRDQIVHLNNDKEIDARSKAQMLKETKELEKMITEAKPFFEGTAVQRMLGWFFSGSDFKAAEFEHYTDELVAHSLSIYKDTF